MKQNNSIRFLCFALLCVIHIQCSNKRVVEKHIINPFRTGVDTCLVDFSQLPFDWDTVFFISGRIDSPSELTSIIGCDYFTKDSDPGTRMVFVRDGEIVYEEKWLTTGRYKNYIYYVNNDKYVTCSRESPLYLVWRIVDEDKGEYYLIRNFGKKEYSRKL